jgi:hypothetical protein
MDGVEVSAVLCSAHLFLHGNVNGIDSSLCLGFVSSDDGFRRFMLKSWRRRVVRGEVPVECFMRGASRSLMVAFDVFREA